MKRTHIYSLLAVSLLTLAGCSSSSETASEPSSTTVTDLGTAIPQSESATASAKASESATSGGPASTRTAPGQSKPVASAEGSKATEAGSASGNSGELTEEEQAKVDAGEYVAATDKHPAYNVPVPVMPEEATEKTAEGAAAFYKYWVDTRNYALRTGDIAPASEITSQEFSDQQKLLEAIQTHYDGGNWVVGAEYSGTVVPDTFKEFSDPIYQQQIISEAASGASYNAPGKKTEDLKAESTNGKPISMTLNWSDSRWQVSDTSGISGIDYEDK